MGDLVCENDFTLARKYQSPICTFSEGGTVSRSALAVVRFVINSNRTLC
jgi:hypothetical protein